MDKTLTQNSTKCQSLRISSLQCNNMKSRVMGQKNLIKIEKTIKTTQFKILSKKLETNKQIIKEIKKKMKIILNYLGVPHVGLSVLY